MTANERAGANPDLLARLLAMNELELIEWVQVEVTAYLDKLSGRFAGMPDCQFWPIYRSLMTRRQQARAAQAR